ncbi:IS630 family transposase, partial [Anabaena catenula FACHB-362]|nr:IS630 family transposase [Anabaena catenula FACHB-362]
MRIIHGEDGKLGESVSNGTLFTKIRIKSLKKHCGVVSSATERVQKLRTEYWEKVKDIDPENLVFLDETGVLLGLARTYARSQKGTRVYSLKPFYRGAKITVIGA